MHLDLELRNCPTASFLVWRSGAAIRFPPESNLAADCGVSRRAGASIDTDASDTG